MTFPAENRSPPKDSKADRMVVVRFLDGRLLKGTTPDFQPTKPSFHVHEGGDESAPPLEVALAGLKAVFFVKTFEGNRGRNEHYSFEKSQGYGRKCVVMFSDGEIVSGYTGFYSPRGLGFFLIPAESESNNTRIFVVNRAMKSLQWV